MCYYLNVHFQGQRINFFQVFQLIYSINFAYTPFVLHVVSILCTLVWTQYKFWMDNANCEAVHYAVFCNPNLTITCKFVGYFAVGVSWVLSGSGCTRVPYKERVSGVSYVELFTSASQSVSPGCHTFSSSSSIAYSLLTGPNSAKQRDSL